MAIHYRDPKTGEYEVIKIPVMKGDQGHAGIHVGTETPPTTDIKLWFDPSDTDNDVDLANRLETTLTACYDYMGNDRGSIKDAADANVEYILGEVNTHHYEGQRITATDTIERQVKQAELKGQTLVNLANYKSYRIESDYHLYIDLNFKSSSNKYTIINYSNKMIQFVDDNNDYIEQVLPNSTFLLNSTTFSKLKGHSGSGWVDNGEFKTAFIVLEGDYTNQDIPYFEGMLSVKAPTVKITGKNLFRSNEVYRFTSVTGERIYADITKICKDFIGRTFEHGVTFRAKITKEDLVSVGPHHFGLDICFQCSDGTEAWSEFTIHNLGGITSANNQTVTYYNRQLKGKTVVDVKECNIFMRNLTGRFEMWDIEMYDGTLDGIPTSYEPYKSNTLTLDGEYRGIGDVCDTVDCITGEVIENTFEFTLEGKENWNTGWENAFHIDNYILFSVSVDGKIGSNTGLCDKMKIINSLSVAEEGIILNQGNTKEVGLRVSTSKVTNIEELKIWLSNNPIKVLIPKIKNSVKTINLKNQKVYSYDGTTHYTCSAAEGSLVPTLSIDVPTNLPALVSKQRQQIEILEKENQVLSNELELAITSSEQNDGELLAQSFELDFRMMEVESALNLPMAATFQLGGKAMAMTPYDMAKKLILAGNYERSDMERKLNVYVSKKRMTEVERQELIQLMNEAEGVVTVEPEAEEFVMEHEAVTIPLH